MMSNESIKRQLVLVGDGGCGKTCLQSVFVTKSFSDKYILPVFDPIPSVYMKFGDKLVYMLLCDPRGSEDYNRLRPLSYPGADVILMCFAIDRPDSLANIPVKWVPEVRHYCPRVPIILLGNKKDLRNNANELINIANNKVTVTYDMGKSMAKSIKACAYLECSALTQDGVNDVFKLALNVAMGKKKRLCQLL